MRDRVYDAIWQCQTQNSIPCLRWRLIGITDSRYKRAPYRFQRFTLLAHAEVAIRAQQFDPFTDAVTDVHDWNDDE